jgi:hypothetical protein
VVVQRTQTENFSTLHLARRVVAPSLAHYFKAVLAAMHAGRIIVEPNKGIGYA